jgi:hypothetical protein
VEAKLGRTDASVEADGREVGDWRFAGSLGRLEIGDDNACERKMKRSEDSCELARLGRNSAERPLSLGAKDQAAPVKKGSADSIHFFVRSVRSLINGLLFFFPTWLVYLSASMSINPNFSLRICKKYIIIGTLGNFVIKSTL